MADLGARRSHAMTDSTQIRYDDIDPEHPDEARSIGHRIASILRLHRQDPDAPDSSCLCGYHGNYYGHTSREVLVGLREEGYEVRGSRYI
jgi:hypothetical protein